MSFEIGRKQYADMYGPTTGDSIRLADTELFIRIEKDYTTYGEECKFGGGKSREQEWVLILLSLEQTKKLWIQ